MAGADKQEYPPLLPLGFHPHTLNDLKNLCVDRFPFSITRPKILTNLESVLAMLNGIGAKMEVWVDGSFLTQKINPDDVDFVARIESQVWRSLSPNQCSDLRAFNKTDFWATHKVDAFTYIEQDKSYRIRDQGEWDRAYWIRQFGFSRKDEPKGLAVLSLPFLII